ncbi:MAG: DUF507 family protein [Nitrospiraceae bacterium]|nr:DUF507 family protein [Nitrospiraceae bacterium]
MRLSEDRISHVSHLIADGILKGRAAEPLVADERVLREIKRVFTEELKFDDEADSAARKTIQSLSRKVPEGSPEWDVLYRKYREEELLRRRKQ